MNLSQKKTANIEPLEGNGFESIEQTSQTNAQLDDLLDLLSDLNIINAAESPPLDLHPLTETDTGFEHWQKLFQSPQILALPPAKEASDSQQVLEGKAGKRGSRGGTPEVGSKGAEEQRREVPFSLNDPSSVKEQPVPSSFSQKNLQTEENLKRPENSTQFIQKGEEEDDNDPFRLLQDLLVEPEVSAVRDLIDYVDKKVAHLEHQIYHPQELIHLLLPVITEILSAKISASKEEVTKAIAPIIDEMIHAKTQQDKDSMSLAIAPILPSAVAQQVLQSPGEFASAMAPEMSIAIKEQIKLERDAMVDALYPIIGNTIAKYMVEVINSINEKVANTLSAEGISRKIRAKVQGVSEAELIFKEAMPFVTQAVFLIQKSSGLVIAEIQQSGSQRLESEMVAGMLTAIRSFVNDCIAQSGTVSELDAIEYGNSQIILEVAGYCYLAVVIQGQPPQWFIHKMRKTLGIIVEVYNQSIKSFDGNPDSIPPQVSGLLEELRDSPANQARSRKPPALLIAIAATLSLIIVPWEIYQYHNKIDRRIEADLALSFDSTPELSIYRLVPEVNRSTLKLTGRVPNQYLRQRAVQIAQTAAPHLKLDNKIIAVEVPPDPVSTAAEVKRVTHILNQMEGIAISAKFAAGKVTVQGSVPQIKDAQKITLAFEQIAGVKSIINTVQPQRLRLETRIYFDLGSAKLNSTNAYDKINQIKAFLDKYPEKSLKIIGHSDPSGSPAENQKLALERAKTVWNTLISQGINPKRLLISGTAISKLDEAANRELWLNRYVGFEPVSGAVRSP